MLGGLGIVAAIVGLFFVLPSELVPVEDRGMIFNIVLSPEGSTLEYSDRYMHQVEAVYRQVPEVEAYFSAVGLGFGGPGRVTDGCMFVLLKPFGQRHLLQQALVGMLVPGLIRTPGALASPSD